MVKCRLAWNVCPQNSNHASASCMFTDFHFTVLIYYTELWQPPSQAEHNVEKKCTDSIWAYTCVSTVHPSESTFLHFSDKSITLNFMRTPSRMLMWQQECVEFQIRFWRTCWSAVRIIMKPDKELEFPLFLSSLVKISFSTFLSFWLLWSV